MSLADVIDELSTTQLEADEIALDDGGSADRFAIDDDDKAAWAVNKILSIDEEEARVTAQYNRALDDIQRRRRELLERFIPELEQYFPAPPEGPRFRDLTTGRIAWRRTPERVVIGDPQKMREWASENLPEAVTERREFVVDTEAVKKATKGLAPEHLEHVGLRVAPAEDRFRVTMPRPAMAPDPKGSD